MEWWAWLLLIVIVVFVALAIWWWWTRMRGAPDVGATPTELPEEWHQALPEPEVPEANDLAEIEGIGPRIHDILNEAGIKTFAQLADTPVERLQEILVAAELRVPVNPQTWPAQARLAAESRWQELKELQDSLKGGISG